MPSRTFVSALALAVAIAATAVAADTGRERASTITQSPVCQAQQPCAPQAVGTLSIPEYPTQITPIYGFTFGATNTISTGTGGGGGAGRVSFSELSVAKLPDAISASLLQDVATGRHLKYVEITVKRGNTVDAVYRLTDVVVVSFQTSPELENVSFVFSRIEFTVGNRTVCFDVATNTSC